MGAQNKQRMASGRKMHLRRNSRYVYVHSIDGV